MPLYKYKTFEEAEEDLWKHNQDAHYFKNVIEFWNFVYALNRIIYPKGIFKFKTIEDAHKQREKVEFEHAMNKKR